jgi:hypothetical protein
MQTPENPSEKPNPESEKNAEQKKTDYNELFRSFIEEYNKNNQKNYDAGKVSAWLDYAKLVTKYANIKTDGHPANEAESMDSTNMNGILEQTKKDDEATIAAWLAFAEKHQNDKENQKT